MQTAVRIVEKVLIPVIIIKYLYEMNEWKWNSFKI